MKRVIGLAAMVSVMLLVSAGSALAQSYPPLPGPSVEGAGGGQGPTAFTGSNVSFGTVATFVLLAVGLTALLVARKRAARLTG